MFGVVISKRKPRNMTDVYTLAPNRDELGKVAGVAIIKVSNQSEKPIYLRWRI